MGAVVAVAFLPGVVLLALVMTPEEPPLDLRAPSVIKCDRPGLGAFLGRPQINTFYDTIVAPSMAIALVAVGQFSGGTAKAALVGSRAVEMAFQRHAHQVNVHVAWLAGPREKTGAAAEAGTHGALSS